MATVVLPNFTLFPCCSPLSSAATFSRPNPSTMHVARPKSAKGRRRPSFSCSQSMAACPCQVPPAPPPAPPHDLVNNRRVLSTKAAFLAGQVSPEEIPELLQQVPSRSSSSLNKYRVLPSIGWRGAVEQTQQLRVREEDVPRIKALPGEHGAARRAVCPVQCLPEKPGGKRKPESPWRSTPEESHLLLAIRSPSGQRFEHHFKPTDSLQTVLAMAEQRMSAGYKHCSVETMEVPRRSFSDLTRSLQECGILHKSVLCIQQKEQRD
ncbi:UBX10 protein, partial [Bucco capensis]|nr:UBX10 protein [Bucco capensis]